MKTIAITYLLLACTFSCQSTARPVAYFSPDELLKESSFVCNGVVVDVFPEKLRTIKPANGIPGGIPHRAYLATIKVLSVFKGDPVDTVQLRFFVMDEEKLKGGIMNPPEQIFVTKGNRYRFYLIKVSDVLYLPCIQNNLDDRCSVEPLIETETNDSPPFTSSNAILIAEQFVMNNVPGFSLGNKKTYAQHHSFNSHHWLIEFYRGVPDFPSSPRVDAKIWVNMDGIVDLAKSTIVK